MVCHEPGRKESLGHPGHALASIEETIHLNVLHGRRTNPAIRCAGVALNTSAFEAGPARRLLAEECARLGLPCADPLRGGKEFERLVEACLE